MCRVYKYKSNQINTCVLWKTLLTFLSQSSWLNQFELVQSLFLTQNRETSFFQYNRGWNHAGETLSNASPFYLFDTIIVRKYQIPTSTFFFIMLFSHAISIQSFLRFPLKLREKISTMKEIFRFVWELLISLGLQDGVNWIGFHFNALMLFFQKSHSIQVRGGAMKWRKTNIIEK